MTGILESALEDRALELFMEKVANLAKVSMGIKAITLKDYEKIRRESYLEAQNEVVYGHRFDGVVENPDERDIASSESSTADQATEGSPASPSTSNPELQPGSTGSPSLTTPTTGPGVPVDNWQNPHSAQEVPYPNLERPSDHHYEALQANIWRALAAGQHQPILTGVEVRANVLPTISETLREYYRMLAENTAVTGGRSRGAGAYVSDYLCRLKAKHLLTRENMFTDLGLVEATTRGLVVEADGHDANL